MRKAFVFAGVSILAVPLFLALSYLAAVYLSPVDALTVAMPRALRSTISNALVDKAHFEAKDFPAARRAARLDPTNESAWTMMCATGASNRTTLGDALQACSRAESMNATSDYPAFHAEVIADAYAEAGRPCDGLPILRKTMGEETVNNISPVFNVGRLEATCGQMNEAEEHLRAVVRLREEDLRSNNWEDRPPGSDGPPDTYEKAFRLYLSQARQNLSSLLALRHKDAEALQVCRAALGRGLSQCTCRFKPKNGVACATVTSR